MLRIVADAHIWAVEEAFAELPGLDVRLEILESRDIRPQTIKHADVLLTRSSTRVDAQLLQGSRIRFAATATIGDDHYDKAYLHSHGIAFANAAGSSTGSVIEYMLTALLWLQHHGLLRLRHTTLGIIGVGRIGSALAEMAARLGMRVLLNDPPRARREKLPGLLPLSELLRQADILTLHTPLIREGEDRTEHLIGDAELQAFCGRGIINAARGACLDNAALHGWLDADHHRFAVLDCWENEPEPDAGLIAHPGMVIATPHIAGHSLDGKAANTLFVYRALCHWLGIAPVWHPAQSLPADQAAIEIGCIPDIDETLYRAATALYPLDRDIAAMRAWTSDADQPLSQSFADYRRHYPVRRAWPHAPIRLVANDVDAPTLAAITKLAHAIGMRCV